MINRSVWWRRSAPQKSNNSRDRKRKLQAEAFLWQRQAAEAVVKWVNSFKRFKSSFEEGKQPLVTTSTVLWKHSDSATQRSQHPSQKVPCDNVLLRGEICSFVIAKISISKMFPSMRDGQVKIIFHLKHFPFSLTPWVPSAFPSVNWKRGPFSIF